MRAALRSERGAALLLAMLFLMVLSILVAVLNRTTIYEMLLSRNHQESQKAFYAAENGLRGGMQWLATFGSAPEDSMTVPEPFFFTSQVTPVTATWSPEVTDGTNGTYRFYVEHLKNAVSTNASGESAKIGTAASAGTKAHYYRITAEGISPDRSVRRQVQMVTTAAY